MFYSKVLISYHIISYIECYFQICSENRRRRFCRDFPSVQLRQRRLWILAWSKSSKIFNISSSKMSYYKLYSCQVCDVIPAGTGPDNSSFNSISCFNEILSSIIIFINIWSHFAGPHRTNGEPNLVSVHRCFLQFHTKHTENILFPLPSSQFPCLHNNCISDICPNTVAERPIWLHQHW